MAFSVTNERLYLDMALSRQSAFSSNGNSLASSDETDSPTCASPD